MANQYKSESLSDVLTNRYNQALEDVLHSFCHAQMSYEDISRSLGYEVSTVRKWCRKYNIVLAGSKKKTIRKDMLLHELTIERLQLKSINVTPRNVLYRRWT